MFGRAIDGIEAQRLFARADHIVARVLGHDDSIVRLDLVAYTIDPDFAFAAFDAEELVPVVVDFLADFVTRLNRMRTSCRLCPVYSTRRKSLFSSVSFSMSSTKPFILPAPVM